MQIKRIGVGLLMVACNGIVLAAAPSTGLNTAQIEQLTGLKGKFNEQEGVFKINYPRSDLQVTVAGIPMTPPMGLTAWAAFKNSGDHTIVMGDLVLTEPQVNAVLSTALDNGLEVTALHNHFFWDSPRIMFMHIGGMGDAAHLAQAVGKVFQRLKETSHMSAPVPTGIHPATSSIDAKILDTIFGTPGETNQGIYKATFGRQTQMQGHEMGAAMGVNTWASFAGTMDNAVVDGDFAMEPSELQNVLKTLRHANINIVAIHNHMINEDPRIVFLHFWGTGSARAMAEGIKTALATQKP